MSLATTKQALVRWHDMATTRDMSILNGWCIKKYAKKKQVEF